MHPKPTNVETAGTSGLLGMFVLGLATAYVFGYHMFYRDSFLCRYYFRVVSVIWYKKRNEAQQSSPHMPDSCVSWVKP